MRTAHTATLSMMPRLGGPSVFAASVVAQVRSYRDACRAAKQNGPKNMSIAMLCQMTGMRPSHASDYFSDRDIDDRGMEMRDMPAKYIPAFEDAVGNTFVSQWLAMQAQLTILEAQIAEQKAVACN